METIKIKTIEVAGLAGALTALRLPFGKEMRSTVDYDLTYWGEFGDNTEDERLAKAGIETKIRVSIDPKDYSLMSTLVRRGDEHAKVLRGVMVWAEIECPIYFARELETYRHGRERLSCTSTMHQECHGLSGEELQKAKAEMPMGTPCKFVDAYSYQTLRRIVHQRKGHRLPEWSAFIDWVASLPFSEELIFTGME